MAVSIITQQPWENTLSAESNIIFTVSNDTAVGSQTKVKFCADVHISDFAQPNLNTTTYLIGTFKTTPNNEGVGMFDFSGVVSNYVSSDNIAANQCYFKSSQTSNYYPIHIIDGHSTPTNSCRNLGIRFYVEYANAQGVVEADTSTEVDSDKYVVFNSYLKETDVLSIANVAYTGINIGDFGFDYGKYFPVATSGVSTKRYLTNAPTTQYANSEDYGTLAWLSINSSSANDVRNMVITYYDDSGTISSADTVTNTMFTGGNLPWNTFADKQMMFFGCFPGNLENWSTNYANAVTAGLTYYTIQAYDDTTIPQASIRKMTIKLNCPDLKNYESIRLCWLNQFGAWDYYTFTKRSIRTTSTKATTYTQLEGTWNESRYRPQGFRGGKKGFRVNAVDRIRINTDFVSEDFNVMFEELTNSPEVYMLDGFQTDIAFSALNNYVTPVRLVTSNFTKKTNANDNLIQYTFEIEKSRTLRTQSI